MNTEELTLVPPSESAHVDDLPRADAPVIWDGYRESILKLKATAETLTITDVSQKDEMKLARTTRLALKNVRVEIESRRKELGEEALRRKQKIDAAAKELKDLIEPLEERLLEQEQFAERAEAARKAALKVARESELTPFLNGPLVIDVASMPDADYDALLQSSREAHNIRLEYERKKAEEAAAQAKAEAEERARVAAENARLKAEAEKREAEIKAEREKAEAAAKLAAEKARKEREEIEAKARAEREAAEAQAKAERQKAAEAARIAAEQARKEREEIEAKARKEREAAEAAAKAERESREKLEAELAAKKAAEAKAEADRLAAEEAAALAPDKDKLNALAATVRALSLPALTTDKGAECMKEIAAKVEAFAGWIEKKAGAL